ncbi:conjugal transfer protein TraI [Tsuneonella deserti]|uniref:Conjugal transfer protein TraI n=1 Tax=Tsuneonella deserti TaxID=2035528 RepID=A0ABQ1SD92_9SPHN|nr:relaxase/mobilization nuclease RlxS [Tsuneonella deserti]GGE06151.1 conjugal transfer protein TraI [Tsuneonella deserti]
MATEDDFEPRLGRIRSRGGKRGRTYLSRVLAATNLARGGPGRSGSYSTTRIGRGAGVGRLLARRDRYAAFRQRRVIVKARLAKLAGKGFAGARAHLRYVQRDGVTRDGRPGELYGRDADTVNGKNWLDRQAGDRHQFRFIVSPEDGDQYADLKDLTRRLMARLEQDLGTRLDWVAVDHFNTGHPHTHVIVRGKDERGRDLVIAPDYLTRGIRERAAELVDLDLGPRSDRDIEARLRAEIDQERLTGIDRRLIGAMDTDRVVAASARDPFQQSLQVGRLATLARLGLAERLPEGRWRLAEGIEDTLRRMGERGDIIRTLQRAYTARGIAPAAADLAIYEPAAQDARPIIGRVLERGLSDEHKDRHYLLVEATDGRTHYVDIGKGEALAPLPAGAIVRIVPERPAVREVDRTIAAVAAANGGRYTIDAHLRHDPTATEAFAETHVRRLEAMRRRFGAVERLSDGSWTIAPDHLDRAAAYEAARAGEAPVHVETLSAEPLERLAGADAATWLDRELVTSSPEPLREAGFGQAVREAQHQRRQWLIAQGLAEEQANGAAFAPGLIDALRRRELLRVAAQLSDELGLPFRETPEGARVEGIYRRPVELLSGRHALIEKSREFTLVPWRPVLDRHVGKTVSGRVRGDGVSWTIGRGRSGPVIS